MRNRAVFLLTRIFLVAVCLLVGGRSSAASPIGILSADRLTVTWIPEAGDTVHGSQKGGALGASVRTALSAVFDTAGIIQNGVPVNPSQLEMAVITVSTDHAEVAFSTAPPGVRAGILWSSRRVVRTPTDEPWLGDVVSFDAGVTVEGDVIGSVLSIGGDVTLLAGSTVRGDVIVIGGTLRQRQDAKVYGRVFAPGGHRRPRLPVPASVGDLAGEDKWRPTVSYDRVDGARIGLGGLIRNRNNATELRAWAGYGIASETGQFELRLRHRIGERGIFDLTGAVFRLTDTDDEGVVQRNENTVFALMTGSDYRDYVGTDGAEIGLGGRYNELGTATMTYRFVDYRWLDAERGLWHLFRRGHNFRRNFWTLGEGFDGDSVLDGRSSALFLTARLAPVANDDHPIGFNGSLTLEYEVSGGLLGGDYDYDRLTLTGQSWFSVARWHRFAARVLYGRLRRDAPPNRLFFAGGLGTLRGFPQKLMAGDKSLIGNIEYEFTYWENPLGDAAVILFFDFGHATFTEDLLEFGAMKSNVGVGLDFGESIRVDLAKRLDRSRRDLRISVRLAKAF